MIAGTWNPFKPTGSKDDISSYKKIRDVAFSEDTLNMQNNTDIIQLSPELAVVLRVK